MNNNNSNENKTLINPSYSEEGTKKKNEKICITLINNKCDMFFLDFFKFKSHFLSLYVILSVSLFRS